MEPLKIDNEVISEMIKMDKNSKLAAELTDHPNIFLNRSYILLSQRTRGSDSSVSYFTP